MKKSFVPALLALIAALFGACVEDAPRRPNRRPGIHPPLANVDTLPPEAPQDVPPPTEPRPSVEVKPPPAVPDQPVKVGEIPYAKPVPGKPGFVFSPYDQFKGYIDVRGFPPGTEVKDPYSGKSFLVP